MYLKISTKNGVSRLSFYEAYYSPKTKKSSQHCVENLGKLEDLKKIYPDPIAHFKEVAKQRTEEARAEKNFSIDIDMDAVMNPDEHSLKNVGYGAFRALYKDLDLDLFWNWKSKKLKIDYSMDDVFRHLVISRAMIPGSKKETFEKKDWYFEPLEGFTLDDVYHALDNICAVQEDLQKWIYTHSESICKRDLSTSYFDCTNYFFDIGRPDTDMINEDGVIVDKHGNPTDPKYRKRGPEKNHRPDPIVEMGLLMDKNGIPLTYNLFPGNESEKVNMLPQINKVRMEYGGGNRIILVADRGLNTSDNIYFLNGDNREENNPKDGYVYGQSVRGASEEFKEWVLSGEYIDTIIDKSESTSSDIIQKDDEKEIVIFRHKSRIAVRTIHVNCTDQYGKTLKKEVKIDQKQMVYYSEKYAKKQRADREVMVNRAIDLIAHPKTYTRVTSAGSAAYIKNIHFDKNTGEVLDGELLLDTKKIKEEEKYDGYYSIVTSELKMDDIELRNIYRGLAKIEDTFKVTKSELQARPVYVWTNEHIEAHFATCFTALVLIRLLEVKLEHKFSTTQILESLRNYSCVNISNNVHQFVYRDEVIDACEKAFNVNLSGKYKKTQEIRRLLRY